MCQFHRTRQLREYIACLRTLQAEGIRVDIPEEWLDRACPLDIDVAPPPISMAFDWPTGGAGYAVWVRLLSRGRCVLEDCALTVSWDDDVVIQSIDECKSWCEFGKMAFSIEEILNHRIENTLRFPRAGHVVEGVILGRGVARISEKYGSFAPAPFTLTLYDQFGEELTQHGHLSVERSRKRMKPITIEKHTLFENSRDAFTELKRGRPEIDRQDRVVAAGTAGRSARSRGSEALPE